MSSKIFSAATVGLGGEIVEVEVDVLGAGLHNFTIVGLPDTAIKESRDRVSSALKNSGFKPPHQCGRITVNLAPADLPKASPIYDLPVALGFLLATGQAKFDFKNKLFVGELALDGTVRSIHGVLPIALLAKEKGIETLFVPKENSQEAAVVEGLKVIPVDSLYTLVDHLVGNRNIAEVFGIDAEKYFSHCDTPIDMCHIKGQQHVKRALEIAAAGGHNILLSGPPGSGKTLLAKAMPSILPRLTVSEALEVTKIFSIAGKMPKSVPIITQRPYRSPHHTASSVSLVGGGSIPRPGEVSLAHRGVLFLDEFAEFSKHVLESLRQPLEDGMITVSRAKGSLEFPAQFILIAAMNPCPCGNATDPEKVCTCSPSQVIRYQQKLSGPILDRIDLHVEVPRIKFEKLNEESDDENSENIRQRVESARGVQLQRFKNIDIVTNNEMRVDHIREHCALDQQTIELLRSAMSNLRLSARAYHRIIKVARTIADLAGEKNIGINHVAEAIQYRFKSE